jgi:hypothetical protein
MRYFILSIITLSSFSGYTQKKAPPWANYTYRAANFPESRYLVGYATELNIAKNQASDAFDKLNQVSRNQIIEQILVSIKAETEMNISVVNTQSDETLEMNSRSASKAQLVGLKFDNYYYKKKKIAYSFSYVLIQDIIDYYNDIIRTNFNIINKNFSGVGNTSDKNTALKLLFEAQVKLREIDQATIILVAMKQANSIDFNTITGMKKQVEDYNNQILGTTTVTIENLANYFAYGLIPKTEEDSKASVCLGVLSYKDSRAESDFSQTLLTSIINNLGSDSELSIVEDDANECDYELSGMFSDSESELIIGVSLHDNLNGRQVANQEKTLNKSVLALDGLRLLPANFERLKDIPKIKFLGNSDEVVIKTDEYIDKPLMFAVDLEGQPQIDLPILFSFNRDGTTAFSVTVLSGKDGKAQYFLNKEKISKSGEYELQTLIDIATLLALDSKSNFYQDVLRDYPPQVRKIKLKVIAPTVYVSSRELNLGKNMDILLLAPAIKNALLDMDYKFVDDIDDADYSLTIEASTRAGQKTPYMSLSYLDATISMYRISTGKEIYKNGLSSAKGGAADFALAGIKAYEKAIDSFLEDFIKELGPK